MIKTPVCTSDSAVLTGIACDIRDGGKVGNEDRFESERFFTLSLDMLCTAGYDGYFKKLNVAWTETLGYSLQELLAAPYASFVHPDDLTATSVATNLIVDGTKLLSFENRYRCKDGGYRWLRWRAVPYPQSRLIYAIVHDITDQKRREETTRSLSSSSYRFLAETMPQIVWTAKADGKLDYFNQRWHEYTGLTTEQSTGNAWQFVIHPDDLQNCVDSWTLSLKTGADFDVEYRLRREFDGKYLWYLGRAAALRDDNGRILHWVGTCTDIDHQKRAALDPIQAQQDVERRVKKRTRELELVNDDLEAEIIGKKRVLTNLRRVVSELTAKNESIENMLHNVSHELKTPLTSALEFVAMVRDGIAGAINATQHDYLTIAKESLDELHLCIDDLLDASAIDTGKLTVHRELKAPGPLISRVAASMLATAASKNIEFETSIKPGLPSILMDEARIRQVIINLLSNALKFTPDGGRIVVSAGMRAGSLPAVRVSVSNSGPAISDDHLTRIFERLYQVKKDTLATEGGLGLGLYISKGIIELHDGTITVQSKEGQDTMFAFTLPIAYAETISP